MNRWRQGLAICLCVLFKLVLLTSKSVDAAGLSYREILHFYVQDGKAQVNQATPAMSESDGLREVAVSLDFSADGKTLAVGYEGVVRFWEVPSGKLQSELRFKDQPKPNPYMPASGAQVRYSPDGQLFAMAALDEILIYARETIVQRCPDYTELPISWSPDSKFIAGSSSERHQLGICNIQTGVTQIYPGFPVSAAEWSPDGKHIAILADTHDLTDYLRVFNAETKELEYSVGGNSSVSWRPDSEELISGTFEGLRIRDSRTAQPRLNIKSGYESSLVWHPSGKRIAELRGSSLTIWNANTGEKLSELALTTEFGSVAEVYRRLAWNRTGSQLAAIDTLGIVHVWEESGEQPPSAQPTSTPTLAPNANRATWTPAPPALTPPSHLPSKIITKQTGVKSLSGLTYVPHQFPLSNGTYTLKFDTTRSEWVLYRRDNAAQTRLILSNLENDIKNAAWSADGRYLAYSQDLANVYILDLQTYQIIHTVHHWDMVTSLTWHPSQSILITSSGDVGSGVRAMLIIYDVRSRKTIYSQVQDAFESANHAWAGNTETLVLWGMNGIRFLDTKTNKQTFLQPIQYVGMRKISPDSRYLAYTDYSPEPPLFSVLDMETRTIVWQFADLDNLDDFGWSPDGKQFLMLVHAGVLTIWEE